MSINSSCQLVNTPAAVVVYVARQQGKFDVFSSTSFCVANWRYTALPYGGTGTWEVRGYPARHGRMPTEECTNQVDFVYCHHLSLDGVYTRMWQQYL